MHLRCHIGTDTVSLARLGARMTGLDFSLPPLEEARRLAASAGVAAKLVAADVHDAPAVLGHGPARVPHPASRGARAESQVRVAAAVPLSQAGIGLHLVKADQFVFTTWSGKPQSRRNSLRAVHAAGDAAGLNGEGRESVGLHDLRHSFVALARDSGATLAESRAGTPQPMQV